MAKKMLFLLLVFVACYLAAHFWIRHQNRNRNDSSVTTRLVECEPNEVRAFTITGRVAAGEAEVLRFERVDQPTAGTPVAAQISGADWLQTGPAKAEGDLTTLNHLAAVVCELYDPMPIPADEFKVGAESPVGRALSLEATANGKVHRLEFGMVGSDRLAMIRYGSKNVRASAQLIQLASLPAEQYKNFRLSRMTADNIQAATVFAAGKEKFKLERAGADWQIEVKGNKKAAGEEGNRYLNRIATLKALGAEEQAGAGENCAKEAHKISVEMTGVGGRKEVLGFDYGPNGDVQACSTIRGARFRVHRDMIKYLEASPEKL